MLEISKVPVYFYRIFDAQFFMLNHYLDVPNFQLECAPGTFDLTKIWMLIEVRLFYGYIFSAMFFLMIASIFKVSDRYKLLKTKY